MLPLNSNQIPALFQKAMGLARAGKPVDALAVFKQLQALAPKRAEVPFQMAQLHARMGEHDKALKAFDKAAKLAPGEATVWTAYAAHLSQHGTKPLRKTALITLKSAKLPAKEVKRIGDLIRGKATGTQRDAGNATKAEIDGLLALVNAGKAQEAETQARALLSARGPNEIILTIQGAALAALGRVQDAETAFRAALSRDPDYAEALAQLGQLLLTQTRRDEARGVLEKARTLIPDNPIVLGNLGKLYNDTNAPDKALDCLDRLLAQAPGNALALYTRAQARLTLEDGAGTLEDLDALEVSTPRNGDTGALRAMALKLTGDLDGAEATINAALKADPNSLRVVTLAANLKQQTGKFDEAETLLRAALDRGVKSGTIYRMIAQGRKLAADDPLVAEMKALWARDDLPFESRVDLGYGLTKLMEEQGDHAAAWTYLEGANAIMRDTQPYDRAKAQGDFDRFTAFAKSLDPARLGTVGHQDNQTIFITGLPRSGTTLVEQILASHSEVTGGDELGIFHPLGFAQVAQTDAAGGTIRDMTPDQLAALGRAYEAAAAKRVRSSTPRITDKTISTYQIAPLVWLALPRAKIVALRRDPRDNLWSILKNRFLTGLHLYSYSQEDLVETYRLYTEYLDQWRQMNPEGLHEISYETLVEDPESEIRKLLAFCELEWEEACLDFHKTKRDVKTLSVAQVRQPLYKSSVGKWEPYAKELAPLLDGLAALTTDKA
ncbi:tetratricopeptide repeat-containing sulfotransferase family protein [Aliiroseovarius marinus]|uniref:tetratricopeptide repeat-containing sulfotransferase family protein n=1 Tax=Aliiroseovarius marinus TaxID=2500159 RepID=UPI003D7DB034